MRRTPILILAISAITLTGCVSARDTHDVALAQAEALDRLAIESALTNAALLHMTSAVSAIRVERAASDAEAQIITERQLREAQLDGDPPRLLLLQTIGVGPGQRLARRPRRQLAGLPHRQ